MIYRVVIKSSHGPSVIRGLVIFEVIEATQRRLIGQNFQKFWYKIPDVWGIFTNVKNNFGLFTTHFLTNSNHY